MGDDDSCEASFASAIAECVMNDSDPDGLFGDWRYDDDDDDDNSDNEYMDRDGDNGENDYNDFDYECDYGKCSMYVKQTVKKL